MLYVEKDCCFKHENRKFCAGGAIVTPKHLIAYPGENSILKDWHGKTIGTWKSVARWPVQSWTGSHMHQIEAIVDGVIYTGRGFGENMLYRGRRKSNQS